MSVGKNIEHDSARGHVTGESIYVDDRPFLGNEVLVDVLGSPVSHGQLKSINFAKALEVEGIHAVYTHKDLANNRWGTIFPEQPLLIEDIIGYKDEPICVIVGDNYDCIHDAKQLIELEIEELHPIYTVDEAIDKQAFCYTATPFINGDVESALKKAPHTLKGDFECGGQDHFYLESQASIVYPLEAGQLEVHSSSQHPSETQHVVAKALGLSYHQVTCIVKRMGGGFGGKESQAAPFAAYAGLAAKNLGRPARIALTKDDDMKITGKRHPFKNYYEVGFDDDGRIIALKAQIYANAGAYPDLSSSILERALFHIDSAYYIEHTHIEGYCCRTNMHSNTAFRGFGGPQGQMTMESIIEDIAYTLKKPAHEIRQINCYGIGERDTTPYGQKVTNNLLPKLFNKAIKEAELEARIKHIENFNAQKTGKLRGLSLTPTKFGIAFTAKFLNQGNALVNVHLDGTVQVSTGATEMGQGVNTKIQQTAAYAFGIDPKSVIVMPTSTEKNHNTSPTAASSGSDINCAATLLACNKIKTRIQSVIAQHFAGAIHDAVNELEVTNLTEYDHIEFKDGKVIDTKLHKELAFKDALRVCYLNRVSLGDYGFFKTEGLGFDKQTGKGKAFNYFTQGVAATEVEIDEYTGELKVLRSDIFMDLGRMINPGIDEGQTTGAFIQGMGWVTSENLYYHKDGSLISHSPTTYKIPNIQDTPREFNIQFIENPDNTVNVFGSKAVGEPPFLLGISAWTAVKNALSYRTLGQMPHITSPATNEVILNELTRVKRHQEN